MLARRELARHRVDRRLRGVGELREMLRHQPIRLGPRLAHGELLVVHCASTAVQLEQCLVELFVVKLVH